MASKTPNYDINYDDKRFTQVESDKNAALTDIEETYGGMISESDKFYDAQIEASKQWTDTQTKLQNEQTDFAIEQIEQQKEQAKKDYTKEQQGAFVDWQKESSRYGANAEQMAAQGFINSGYGESAQVAMYNQYQNRVATAKQTYDLAVQNYTNMMKEARLVNSAALAEIAYKGFKEQLELGLAGFQYKNDLVIQKAQEKRAVDSEYYGRYQDVLAQLNQENAMAEQIRQYEQDYAEGVRRYEQDYAEGVRQFNEEMARLKANDQKEQERWAAELAEEQRQFDVKNSSESGDSKVITDSKVSADSKGGTAAEKLINDANNLPYVIEQNNNYYNGDSEPVPDMASIMALGYGKIDAKTLDKLVREGVITETVKDGKLYYSKNKTSNTNNGGKKSTNNRYDRLN